MGDDVADQQFAYFILPPPWQLLERIQIELVAQSRERGWPAQAHVHTIPSRSMLAIDRLEGSDKGPAADHADGGNKGGRWGSDNGVPFRPPETLMR